MSDLVPFRGNCPHAVMKDAKYSVKYGPGGPVVGVLFRTNFGEKWQASTAAHPRLAQMVNEVKKGRWQSEYGSFYINEYKQVIVPGGDGVEYYYAGEYAEPLLFDFYGTVLCGDPKVHHGRVLNPGDAWEGPHPGIPYVLCAGGKDIRYTDRPRPQVEREIRLSQYVGSAVAAEVSTMVAATKTSQGGKFCVNEFSAAFAPVLVNREWQYKYLGQIDLTMWFPKPNVDVTTGPNPSSTRSGDQLNPHSASGASVETTTQSPVRASNQHKTAPKTDRKQAELNERIGQIAVYYPEFAQQTKKGMDVVDIYPDLACSTLRIALEAVVKGSYEALRGRRNERVELVDMIGYLAQEMGKTVTEYARNVQKMTNPQHHAGCAPVSREDFESLLLSAIWVGEWAAKKARNNQPKQ